MQQHELFQKPPFSLTPCSGRTEPALWVRRLVVWREPDDVIRDVELAPGLNIIWSPDSAAIGHGGGKTLFCRCLRYCLGEDTYATSSQRERIAAAFPQGRVGAEIVLQGRPWAVVRAFADRRHDQVIEGGDLSNACQDSPSAPGMRPLRDAITRSLIGETARLMPVGENGAWGAALAWCSRDQECRFGHHLEWREPEADSRSPVGRSKEDRLSIVRALIGALRPEELPAARDQEAEDGKLREIRSNLERLDWQIRRAHTTLAARLGETAAGAVGTSLAATAFKSAATERLSRALNLPDDVGFPEIEMLRRQRDEARMQLERAKSELAQVDTRIDEKQKTLSMLRGQLPEAHASLDKQRIPICPVCKVPIDQVKAQGCGIALNAFDIDALQEAVYRTEEAVQNQQQEIAELTRKKPVISIEVETARQRYTKFDDAVRKVEKAQLQRSSAIRNHQRLLFDAERYEDLVTERANTERNCRSSEQRLADLKGSLSAHRSAASDSLRTLSEKFDSVLRELVPGDIAGEAKLDRNGLTLRALLGGERSTAAIESLKVIAFDLAVLAMTIEGRTCLPGFLIHDSPREADLGRSIYHRLFDFAETLEAAGPTPLFQYIVTTTTEPPERFQEDPRLRLILRGAPAEDRLLKADL